MPRNNAQLDDSERITLDLVGRYRLIFPEALKELAKLKSIEIAREVLRQLAKKKYLQPHTKNAGLAPNVPYYTLSPIGASALGLSRDRAAGFGTDALSNHLSNLWFCAFSDQANSIRVDNDPINKCFGTNIHHNVIHCVSEENGRIIVWRTYSPSTSLKSIATWCSTTLRKLPPQLKEAVDFGQYGLAILVEVSESMNNVRRYLEKPYKKQMRLNHRVRILIDCAPNTATFQEEFNRKFNPT